MQRTTPHTLLEQQAAQAGIADSYINAHGRVQAISAQTKRRLLDAMPPRTPADAPLPAVLVAGQRSTPVIALRQGGHYHWSLTLENDAQPAYQGRLSRRKHLALPHDLPLGYHRLLLSGSGRAGSLLHRRAAMSRTPC